MVYISKMYERIKNMKQKEELNELELLRMERLDNEYLEERLEYKRFLEELVEKFSSYYYRVNNYQMDSTNNNIFNFNTYRYEQLKPYLEIFLNSYQIGRIVSVKNICKAYPEAKEIEIKFNCMVQDLVNAMWSEIQMLDYYAKSVEEVKIDYINFLKREEAKYKPLLNKDAYSYYVHNMFYFNQKFNGNIPANIIYRIITMLEKNYYFKNQDNQYQDDKYVQGLINLGLAKEYIMEITGYTPKVIEKYCDNPSKNR